MVRVRVVARCVRLRYIVIPKTCDAEMEAGGHVTLPTYFNYAFNIAVGLEYSTDLEELYGLAHSSAPPREKLKLCNGKSEPCVVCTRVLSANQRKISANALSILTR